jgi:hypothetical protein
MSATIACLSRPGQVGTLAAAPARVFCVSIAGAVVCQLMLKEELQR